MLAAELQTALEALLGPRPDRRVTVATVGRDGGPHATPMVLGWDEEHLYLSLTGKQKVRNLERDPRVCISIDNDEDLAHIIVWGSCAIRHDAWAQQRWDAMTLQWAGAKVAPAMARSLGPEGTQLGVVTPSRWRIYPPPA